MKHLTRVLPSRAQIIALSDHPLQRISNKSLPTSKPAMPELVVQIDHTVTTSRLFCSRKRRCTVFLCRLVTFALIGVDPLLSIYLNFQDRKVKSLVSDLLALKQSTDSDPLLERAFAVPHIPRHIFVLASPATIGQVVRRLSLPLPHLIPCEEWKNSMDTVQWTQRRGYPVGSFVKILQSGPYHGDLGYVMAVDLKDGKSNPNSPLLRRRSGDLLWRLPSSLSWRPCLGYKSKVHQAKTHRMTWSYGPS